MTEAKVISKIGSILKDFHAHVQSFTATEKRYMCAVQTLEEIEDVLKDQAKHESYVKRSSKKNELAAVE